MSVTDRAGRTRDAIKSSARHELALHGILGLRLADVAERAHTSITAIYRHFGDRDGLLADVLGDIYEDFTTATVMGYMARLDNRSDLTIEDLVEALPIPFDATHETQKFRVQILATAYENDALTTRLRSAMAKRRAMWQETIDRLHSAMAPGQDFDERVFWVVLFDYMPYASQYLDEDTMSAEELRAFLVDKLRANSQPRS